MGNILHLQSISQVYDMLGYEKPKHPLIAVFESSKIPDGQMPEINQQVVSDLYTISLKNGDECRVLYGRKNYDFQEGTIMFTAPNQIIMPVEKQQKAPAADWHGWSLLFHPDLIRKTSLGAKIKEYTFFSYDSHEALHISETERETVNKIVDTITHEYSQNLDVYSHDLIISNLEVLLNYCKRFYGRQFITRTTVNKDIITKFEDFLESYFASDKPEREGLPTVKYCAREMGYSPNYLSDLLKKETGKNTQEHIHFYLIEQAKTILLGTEDPVYQVAYSLGFEYPQHFSKLFKKKTGMSPIEYRK